MSTDDVDVNSLNEFEAFAAEKESDLDDIINELDKTDRLNRVLPAGEFVAGLNMQQYYTEDRQALWNLAVDLKNANEAVRKAAETIAENYTTTEEQNALNTDQVAGVLDDVGVPSGEGDQ